MNVSRKSIQFALNAARHHELELCRSRFLSPVIKLDEPKTHAPWLETYCPAVTIKAQDIINLSDRSFKPVFEQIRAAGGIHRYLGFHGNVILSSIMRDRTIREFTPERYVLLIKSLKPNYFMTPDGETYFGERHLSKFEIERMLDETSFILDNCPESKPIGLVKGCNLDQIEWHTNELLREGITLLALHIGDFICGGTNNAANKARYFAERIRKKAPRLIIYGLGSSSNIHGYSFADGFITQSHFVNAFYGQRMANGKWEPFIGTPTREIIMENLRAIEEKIIRLEAQPTLLQWATDKNMLKYLASAKRAVSVGA